MIFTVRTVPIPVRRYTEDELMASPKAFLDACQAAGYPFTHDHNHPDSTGVGYLVMNRVDEIRMSTAVTYLQMARERMNLRRFGLGCWFRRVLIENGRAVGVEVESGGESYRLESDLTILSGGAINSPQLLMLSGVGPADHLGGHGIPVVADVPGVGQNLRDHIAVFMSYESDVDEPLPDRPPPLQIGMRYTTPDSPFRNDMHMRPITIRTEHVPVDFDPSQRSSPTGFSIALQKAVGSGELRLASADPHEQPILDYRYLSEPFDAERLRGAVRLAAEISSMPEYEPARMRRLDPTDEVLADDDALNKWLLGECEDAASFIGDVQDGVRRRIRWRWFRRVARCTR